MRIFVLCDDFWHPARTPRAGLQPLTAHGFEFDFVENANDWSPERMSDYPLTILTKSNNVTSTDPLPWMTEQVETTFVNYVHAGKGLLVVHSGAAGYENTPTLRRLMGGVFMQHPPQCDVTVNTVVDVEAAITKGVQPFTVTDEHYHMALDDSQAVVFVHTSSIHGTQPGGWTRLEGAGRVCMLTPGHNLDVWLHPAYQTLLENAMRWCIDKP